MSITKWILSAVAAISTQVCSANDQTNYAFSSDTHELTVVASDEGYEIQIAKTESGLKVFTEFGDGFSCSPGIFGDGTNENLKLLNCEKALNGRTFLLINVYPNKADYTKVEAEIELFDSGLGTLMYQKFGSDFIRR